MSTGMGPITVVLATDSFLIGDGLAAILAENPDELAVGDFPSGPVPTECGGSKPHAECAAAAFGSDETTY